MGGDLVHVKAFTCKLHPNTYQVLTKDIRGHYAFDVLGKHC